MSKARDTSWLHLAHLTLEARTPLSSSGGDHAGLNDMAIVRGPEGLPRVTGASLQGALRGLADRVWGWDEVERVFGWQQGEFGQAGRLLVSDGLPHGAKDKCIPCGWVTPNLGDEVIRLLAERAPVRRDHVRLTEHGVAAHRGKYERTAVPAGTRFSFELVLFGIEDDKAVLERVIALAATPDLRLGGGAARGYGAMTRVRAAVWSGHLASVSAEHVREARAALFSDVSKPFIAISPAAPTGLAARRIDIRLTPVGPWRIGQQGPSRTVGKVDRYAAQAPLAVDPTRTNPDNDPDKLDAAPKAVPLREPRIRWEAGDARVVTADKAGYVVPAAGMRGALAHRTLFHFNRLAGRFADDPAHPAYGERPPALVDLFGDARDGRGGATGSGRAGRLRVEDAHVDLTETDAFALRHNSIDRFTGGVRNHILYDEELLVGGRIELTLWLAPRGTGRNAPPAGELDRAEEALGLAIDDLCEGRLALGARSLGFMRRADGANPGRAAA
jgi:CRISPR/Cas system CSM-associated protein Csm3 (group 7 of RAMP superfamily)